MFTLPALPPVDYEIKEVTPNLLSSQEFTPDSLPRVTYPTVAKFSSPVDSDDLQPGVYRLIKAAPKIVDIWAKHARAEWVGEPQNNGYDVHEMYKKYNVIVDSDYDPRFKFSAGIFSRSFKYELDCIEVKRQEKLAAKVERELKHLADIDKARELKKIAKRPPSVEVLVCKHTPPFWWSFDGVHETKVEEVEMPQEPEEVDYVDKKDCCYSRWQKKPHIFSNMQSDPCQRQLDMRLVGQRFKNEAINWYYTNYPPPDIPFKPKRMEKFSTENLILLEFLVDRVSLDEDVVDNLRAVGGETCVSFQFLDNAPLHVCEEDFSPSRPYSRDTGTVKNGKSCLFSITPEQAEACTKQFDIYVTVFKKMQPGVLPDKIQVGETLISVVNLFNELVKAISERTDDSSPAAKTLKDCFKVTKQTGEQIGHISVYIRMSCFGKLIVTQFQMDLQDKSVQFKANEGHYLFKYNKGKKDQIDVNRGGGMGGRFPNMTTPCVECDPNNNPEAYACPMPYNQQYMQQPPCLQPMPQPPMPPCMQPVAACPALDAGPGCYQEIGAEMGGNALKIRVHKDKKPEEPCLCGKPPSTPTDSACPGMANGLCPANQQDLKMSPGVQNQQPFEFKMAGCGAAAGNNVTVVPPVATAPDGTQFTELSDPNRDVFILRIGKKSEGVCKKNNLELELCTPKGPDLKPAPKKETRDTQYDPNDCGPAEKAGKGKKGGKDKKGKGGKGGKGKGKGGKKGKKK